MKEHYKKIFYQLALLLVLLIGSSSVFAVNNLEVSGVTGAYTNANGTYIYMGLDGFSHNYWKHSTNTYYIYWNNDWSNWDFGISYTDFDEYIVYDEVTPMLTVNQIPWASPEDDANPENRVWSGNADFFPMIMVEVASTVAPTVSTTAPGSITSSSATIGGNVTADGGAAVSERGVTYSSTDATPSIGESGVTKIVFGIGTGSFSQSVGSLTQGTTYYFRAYAINSAGTSYGSVSSFTTLAPEIEVRGNTVTIADGDASPDPNDHTDFGSVAAASGTISRTFTIQNTGSGELTLGSNAVSVSGGQSADFSITDQPAISIAAGGSDTFTMEFNPSAIGSRSTTVNIANDDSDENPYNFSIQGTGLNSAPTDIALSASSINENVAGGSTVGTLSTTDADGGTHTYTLEAGTGADDNGSFSISGTSLIITNSPNFESKSSYSVRVQTSDGTATYAEAFSITINDANEAPTDISLTANTVVENAAGNTVIGGLSSTDQDAGNTFTYTLVAGTGGDDNAAFNIDGSNLRITNSPDYETKSSYSVLVRSTDQGSLYFEKQFTITVSNIDAPTVTTASISTFDGTSATLGGEVTATGGTSVTERGVVYSKTSENSDPMISGSNVTQDSNGDGTGTFGESITGLAYNTQYSVKAYAINSEGTSYGSVQTFTTSAAATSTFLSAGSGNWSDPTKWSNGVPGSTTDVTVGFGTLVINGNYTCDDLTISSGAVVSIAPTQTLTVGGVLTNNAGTAGLVLQSDATGTGMLMNNSTGVQATVQQYLVKDQWHYMGIPVRYIADANDVFHNCYLAWIEESNAVPGSTSGWEYLNRGDSLIALHGYAVQYNRTDSDNDTTIVYTGVLNTGVIDTVFASDWYGYNFISNPYPVTLDWDASGGKTLTNTNNAIYLWNPSDDTDHAYGSYNAYVNGASTNGQTRYIAPNQGFFVQVITATAGLSFNNNAKVVQPVAFKSATTETHIRLAVTDNGINFDEMLLRVNSGSTLAFDGNYDASKFKALNSKLPLLYSVFKGEEYSINSIPEITESTVIPMEVLIKTTGQHTLSLTELTGYNEALPIVLFNEAGQQLANLQTGDYTFTAQAGEIVKVKLAFNTVLTSAEQFSNSFLRVAIDGNNLSVSGLGQGRSDVQLLSISGQLLQSHQPVGDALQVRNLNRGVYLLRVKDSNGLLGVRKVVIQ